MPEKPPINPNTPDSKPSNNPEVGSVSPRDYARFKEVSIDVDSGVVDSFLEMTYHGKKIITGAYERLYDVPVRAVGKIGIAYKSFWLYRNEKKAAGKKAKMDGFDIAMAELDKASQNLTEVIDNLKQQNIPGSEAVQLKLKVIEKQKAELQNGKDKAQTKFEARDNKVKTFTNERDAIADKLIGRYEEKLVPLEGVFDRLQHNRDHIEMEFSVLNLRHQEALDGIKRIDGQRIKMEKGLRLAGMSDRTIRNFPGIKTLESIMASGRNKIRTEKERMTKRRNAIEKKIAKADKKANPYRGRRDEFVRVKQGRPIDMKVETRSSEKDEERHEETLVHTRKEQVTEDDASEADQEDSEPEVSDIDDAEVIKEGVESTFVSTYILGWNKYLNDKYGKDKSAVLLDAQSFFTTTGLSIREMAHKRDFGDVLGKYYKYNGIPVESFKKDVDDYINNYVSK